MHQSLYFRPGEVLEEEGFLSEDVRPGGTYKTLAEQREVLTPAEERFEKGRRTIGLFLAPLVTIIFLLLPIDIPPQQQVLAGVLLGFLAGLR